MPPRAALAVGLSSARAAAGRVRRIFRRAGHQRVSGLTAGPRPGWRGPALLSYLAAPVLVPETDPMLLGHSNAWESARIARTMAELGFSVDVVDWDDARFAPERDYALALDIHGRLPALAGRAARTILHVTGSHPAFSTDAEHARLAALERRRGVRLRARRAFAPAAVAAFDASLAAADTVTLIGDERTRDTFPPGVAPRMRLVPVTGSHLTRRREPGDAPGPRTFLWFGGSGAVHKGLDVTLEAFARQPDLTLHVVGPYEAETDFVRAYARELYDTPNIRAHGFLRPSDPRFHAIALSAGAFVLPSCSESISTAAVTCLQFGLYPVVSTRCGIAPPEGAGHELLACTPEEVEAAVRQVSALPPARLAAAIALTQRDALERFSREAFGDAMRREIERAAP